MSPRPPAGSRTIAFDGDDLQLVFDRRGSDNLLMTFTVRPNPGKKLVGFAAGLAEKYGFDGIYVISKWPHWWQTPELAEVERLIRESGMVQAARHSLSYGASMGAHGVLLTAARLGFRSALMIAPQVSLSPALVPFENRWNDDLPGIRFTEPDGRVGLGDGCQYLVVFDPRDRLDQQHVAMLPARDNIRLLPMPFGGHTLPEFLRQAGVLSKLVVGMARGEVDPVALRRMVRANRRNSPHYFDMMSRALLQRGHHRRAVPPARRWLALEPDSLPAFGRLNSLLRTLKDNDALLALATEFTRARPDAIEGWRALRLAAYQAGDHGLALEAARAAMGLPKTAADDWRWLVRCLLRAGLKAEAAESFAQADALYPESLELLRTGAQALKSAGQAGPAAAVAQRAAAHPQANEADQKVLQDLLGKVPTR